MDEEALAAEFAETLWKAVTHYIDHPADLAHMSSEDLEHLRHRLRLSPAMFKRWVAGEERAITWSELPENLQRYWESMVTGAGVLGVLAQTVGHVERKAREQKANLN